MKNKTCPILLLVASTLTLGLQGLNAAVVVPLGAYVKIGTSTDASASALSASGGTVSYTGSSDVRNDIGISSVLGSSYTFVNVNDTLEYRFTLGSITNAANSANLFRSGFDFDSGNGNIGAAHVQLGIGTNTDARARANNSGNPFSEGVTTGMTTLSAFLTNDALLIKTGNSLDVTLTLKYTGVGTGSTFNYLITAQVQDTATGAIVSPLFQQALDNTILGKTVVSVYNLTNSATIEVAGNSWTISGAAVTSVPEPATVGLLLGVGVLALVIGRRRRLAVG
jgi:hypothetical protein